MWKEILFCTLIYILGGLLGIGSTLLYERGNDDIAGMTFLIISLVMPTIILIIGALTFFVMCAWGLVIEQIKTLKHLIARIAIKC